MKPPRHSRSGDYRARIYFASPVNEVWNALTDREELAKWLFRADFRPVAGHRFRWRDVEGGGARSFSGSRCPLEGAECEVIEVDPLHRLRLIARAGRKAHSEDAPETFRMTWTLEVAGAGTWLTLEQEFAPEAARRSLADRLLPRGSAEVVSTCQVASLDPARRRRHPSFIHENRNDERKAA